MCLKCTASSAKRYTTENAKPDQGGVELAVVVEAEGCLVLLHPQPPTSRNSDEDVPRSPQKQQQAWPLLRLAPEKRGGELWGLAAVEAVVVSVEQGVEPVAAAALAAPRVSSGLGKVLPMAYQVAQSTLPVPAAGVVVARLVIGQMQGDEPGEAGLATFPAAWLGPEVAEVFVVVAV